MTTQDTIVIVRDRDASRFVVVAPQPKHQEPEATKLGVLFGRNDTPEYFCEFHNDTSRMAITSSPRRARDPTGWPNRRRCADVQ